MWNFYHFQQEVVSSSWKKNDIIIIKEINKKKLTLGRTEGGGRGGGEGVQGGCHPSDFFSYAIKHQHLKFYVAVRLSLASILRQVN